MVWGSIIGAAGSIIGGLLGQNTDNTLERIQLKRAVTLRAEDARNAGIHPLAALGAGWPNYQSQQPSNSLGNGISNAASMLGQAIDKHLVRRAAEAEVESQEASAEVLRAQAVERLASARRLTTGTTTGAESYGTPEANDTVVGWNIGDPTETSRKIANVGEAFVSTTAPDGSSAIVPNMETASDPETDLWTAAVHGQFRNRVAEIYNKNTTAEEREALKQIWRFFSEPDEIGADASRAMKRRVANAVRYLERLEKKYNSRIGKSVNDRFMK